jgi:Putative Ig domain
LAKGPEAHGSFVPGTALEITTAKLPTAHVDKPYVAQLLLAGKTKPKPVSWSAFGLPSGLSLGSTNGEVTGRPTAAGTFVVVLLATANHGISVGGTTLSLTVVASP